MKKIVVMLFAVATLLASMLGCVSCGDSNVKIGVQEGTTAVYYLNGDDDWGFDGFDNVTTKEYSNGGLAVYDLKNGNLDYVLIDEAPGKVLVENNAEDVKIIDVALTEEEYAFGVDKEQTDLLANVNSILTEIQGDGRFDAIMEKYFNGEDVEGITSGTKDTTKADEQLVVATNAAFAPFEYMDGNKYAGVDMEIAQIIADELELELVIENMSFDAVVTSVGKNSVDIAMAGLTVSEDRKTYVDFTNSYYNASQMLITPIDDTTFDDMDADGIVETLKGL